ncbi:MAG: TonB-dependent receptor, partial [Lysobacterales bacterium]
MKSLVVLQTALLLACAGNAWASPPPDDPPGDAARVRVEALEAELSTAQMEVSRLEAELASARQDLARLEKPPADSLDGRQAVALTRLQENRLEDGGVRDITRIDRQVPGLIYGQTGNEARFALRGAYTDQTGPEGEPVLGIYQDGVQATTTTDALGPYVDIEKIDVLRGPQGVLYGRNALAGVIDVSSNKPDPSAWDTALEGIIGSSDLTRFEAMLNIPVHDTFAIRLAGASESYQGYVNNYVLEESDADDLKTRMQQYVRLGMRWQPTADFSLQLNFASLDQNGTGSGMWGYQQIGYMADGIYYPGHGFAPEGASADYGPWDIARNMGSLAELENLSTTLVLDWSLGFADLRWLANKSKFESLQAFDADYSNGGSAYDSKFSPSDAGVNGWDSLMDTWSSDLRLQSRGQGRLDWFAGLNFMSQETDWGWLETVNSVLQHPAWDLDGLFTKDSTALYGGAGYRLSERARVFAGLRWYEDEKQLRDGMRDSWDGVLWNAGFEYALTDRTSSYLTASTGYRPGGINERDFDSYDPETVNAYEIGLNTLFLDGTLTLDFTAFLHDYQDVQAAEFMPEFQPSVSALTTAEIVLNEGGKEVMGVEAEFEWSPNDHWHIAAQAAWLD